MLICSFSGNHGLERRFFAGALGIAGLWQLLRSGERLPRLTWMVAAALYGGYGSLAVLGRMNIRPETFDLPQNSYYAYTGLLFALLAANVAWSRAVVRWSDGARTVFFDGIGHSKFDRSETRASSEHRSCRCRAGHHDPASGSATIRGAVNVHQNEPDFAFRIDYTVSDAIPLVYRTTHHRDRL